MLLPEGEHVHVTVPDLSVAGNNGWPRSTHLRRRVRSLQKNSGDYSMRRCNDARGLEPLPRPMNGYLLDTNIVTAHLKKNPVVRQRLHDAEATGQPVRLNAVSYYENAVGSICWGARTIARL